MLRILATAVLISVTILVMKPIQPVHAENGTITGIVYLDKNLDGRRDSDEPGLPGRTVGLYEDSNEAADLIILATTKSGADGSYRFDGLDDSSRYGVAIVRDAATPCISNGTDFYSPTERVSADLPVVPLGERKISGKLLNDLNENGAKDEGEPPLGGWTLRLDGGEDYYLCEIGAVSAENGDFEFDGLLEGTYRITPFTPPSADIAHWELTFPAAPFDLPGALPAMRFPEVHVDLSSDVDGMEIGLHVLSGTASLGAWTYVDRNNNRNRDPGEETNCCQVLFLRETNAGLLFLLPQEPKPIGVGHYELSGLPTGDYVTTLATWMPNPIGDVTEDGRPIRFETLGEGEVVTSFFGFSLVAPSTPVPAPTSTPQAVSRFPPTGQPHGKGSSSLEWGAAAVVLVWLATLSWRVKRRVRRS